METKAHLMVNTEKKSDEAAHYLDPISQTEAMPEVESAEAAPKPFLEEVDTTPGGETVRWCAQCGTCSSSCPNVAQMDFSPRRIIAMIRAGRRHDVLTSNTMWICASCYMCTVRCPRGVKITELMHTLERMATRHGLTMGRTAAAMHRVFIDSIKKYGRVHEFGMMLKFYLSTIPTGKINPMATIKMLPLALKLLTHGRMALKPTKIKGNRQLKTIVDKARTLGGTR